MQMPQAARERVTSCRTCMAGHQPTRDAKSGKWVHLYEDGSLVTVCFDQIKAPSIAAKSSSQTEG